MQTSLTTKPLDGLALAGRDLARALDATQLMRDASYVPDRWQEALLKTQAKRTVIAAARQVGKSTCVAARALHVALFEPGALVLLISPSLRQSSELFRKCLDLYRAIDSLPGSTAESALRIEFANGSRIVSLPGGDGGQTVRGFSKPQLVVIDEAAFVSDTLVHAVLPMLAANADGQLIVMSSPNGLRGFFSDTWHADADDWHRIKVTWKDCPRISQEMVDLFRRTAGEIAYRQEFCVEFMDDALSIFPIHLLDAAFSEEVEAWAC